MPKSTKRAIRYECTGIQKKQDPACRYASLKKIYENKF